jgi:hypothetical protein
MLVLGAMGGTPGRRFSITRHAPLCAAHVESFRRGGWAHVSLRGRLPHRTDDSGRRPGGCYGLAGAYLAAMAKPVMWWTAALKFCDPRCPAPLLLPGFSYTPFSV